MDNNSIATFDQTKVMEAVLIHGDLSSLNPEQKINHLRAVCHSMGLNELTNPLAYIKLNNKLVLYCKKDATDQLRKIHSVSCEITDRSISEDICVVTAKASLPSGRCDESTGAVFLGGLKGEQRANALMKAETKAKRRATLSICGLGFLDETEVETIPDAQVENVNARAVHSNGKEVVIQDGELMPFEKHEVAIEDRAEYTIPVGSNKGKKLKDLSEPELRKIVNFADSQMKEGKKVGTGLAELSTMARLYLFDLQVALS